MNKTGCAWCLAGLLLAACTFVPPPGGGPDSGGEDPAMTWSKKSWPNGGRYEGEMVNGKRHGRGTYIWPDGARYEGEFRNDQRTGYGVFTWPTGARYEGEFLDGKRHGRGTFVWPDGAKFSGEYRYGRKHGAGTFYSADKSVVVCQLVPQEESQAWEDGNLVSRVPQATAKTPGVVPEAALDRAAAATATPSGPAPFPPDNAAPRQLGDTNATAPRKPVKEDAWREPRTGMSFVRVPEGCFQMGSRRGNNDERPPHSVCVDEFWMGRFEVTRGQWERIMGQSAPGGFEVVIGRNRGQEEHPVETVSWNDVQGFISRLNQASGSRFRLPTEAEWEYACRGGGLDDPYCGGADPGAVAWFNANSEGSTHPVGTRSPNRFGLYDMSGNVWEWVSDWYEPGYYFGSPKRNPAGPESGNAKVFRGGAWLSDTNYIRATVRYKFDPEKKYNLLGFRLVRMP
ncbi:MAG: SUMF1/EgtB/PvdO family nonheme iron enzyme [Magnetococcales bacterium]|nr:SUMF1/EgtB/PvdO family nonheme iron enzyme [Magnetococcales bacterium]